MKFQWESCFTEAQTEDWTPTLPRPNEVAQYILLKKDQRFFFFFFFWSMLEHKTNKNKCMEYTDYLPEKVIRKNANECCDYSLNLAPGYRLNSERELFDCTI